MRLINLHIQNVRQHADSVIEFPERGIVGLTGPNEAGKSTVLESCVWALYGTKAIRGSKASFRWNRCPSTRKASVRLEFEVSGSRYVIERDESTASVRLAGALELLASGTSAVDAYVPTLVGMTLDEFRATYLCEQKSIDRIASMGPTERQQFVRKVMGIDRIDVALKACRGRASEMKRDLAALSEGLGDRAPLVAERDAATAALTEAHATLRSATVDAEQATQAAADAAEALQHMAALFDRHTAADRELNDAQRAEAAVKAELDRLAQALADAGIAADKVDAADEKLAELPGLRERKEQLVTADARQRERASLQQLVKVAALDVLKYTEQVETIAAAIAAYDDDAHERAHGEHAVAVDRLNDLQLTRRDAKAKAEASMTSARKEHELTQRRIAELDRQGEAGACPTCQRVLGDQLAFVLALLRDVDREQLARMRTHQADAAGLAEPSDDELAADAAVGPAYQELEAHRERARAAERAQKDRPGVARQLEQAQAVHRVRITELAATPDVQTDPDALRMCTAAIAELEALEKEIAPLRGDVARIPELARQNQLATGKAADAGELVALRRHTLDAIAFDMDAYQDADEAAADARYRASVWATAQVRAEGAATAAGERLTRAESALAAYDTRGVRVTALRTDIRIHETAARRLDEFRDDQVQLLRPELEALVSGFVSLLTDGRHESVTVDDEFNVILQESGVDMEIVSGGTQDVTAIALRLAISQMIAERAGHPLSLLILDEPMGSLSEVRRGNVMNLLRQLGDLFEQVVLVSHIEETKYAVDHVIEIAFDEAAGCSTVTQTTAPKTEAAELAEVAA